MPGAPLVSVVIPCYNHGAFLGEALRSIGAPAATTEIVVVDDGSTDSTSDVVATFETSRPFRCVRQRNAGLAAARILARINDNGSCRISDLAEQERSSQPTITNHVKRLESAGFVERSPDADDARAWRRRAALSPRSADEQ